MQNLDLWFFLNIFKKRWNVIIFVAFAAAIVAGVYSKLFIKPTYESTVQMYFGRVTEGNPLESAIAANAGQKNVRKLGSELALGSALSSDYNSLINTDIVREAVRDELAKTGRWKKGLSYSVSCSQQSRFMNITISSPNPAYSQEVASIYAQKFIEKVQQLIGVQNAQITKEPQLAGRSADVIIKNMGIGFGGGFLVAFAFFVLIRLLDRTIRTSAEVEEAFQVPVIGTVHEDKDYTLDEANPLVFSGQNASELQRSQIAEDFRVFRVNLMNQKKEGQEGGSVIAVTSSHAKEGKTFCTANLGAALAEAGYKVLLVDCDTSKHGLQSYLGKKDDKGLMNILTNDTTFDEAVKKNLDDMKMDVLFCGNPYVNSANLMVSPQFKELMNKIKKQYDYALLDVSCHLGSADIVSAGRSADSVLLLVRAGKTDNAMVQQTVDSLKRANLEVSGVILNGVEDD